VGDLYCKIYKLGRVEVDDAGFDVVAGVDEGEMVSFAARQGVCVAGVLCVDDVGDCGQGLVFVGAADVWVGCDFSGLVLVLSLMIVVLGFGVWDLLLCDSGFLLGLLPFLLFSL
jgi:hypothetical protein